MIYTVTFNPSIDYIVSVDDLKLGSVNRTSEELMFPGGKGINVSMVPDIVNKFTSKNDDDYDEDENIND